MNVRVVCLPPSCGCSYLDFNLKKRFKEWRCNCWWSSGSIQLLPLPFSSPIYSEKSEYPRRWGAPAGLRLPHNLLQRSTPPSSGFGIFNAQSKGGFGFLGVSGAGTLETHNPGHRSGVPLTDRHTGCLYLHRYPTKPFVQFTFTIYLQRNRRWDQKIKEWM